MHVQDFASWRTSARLLLADGIPPQAVTWLDAHAPNPQLFFDSDDHAPSPAAHLNASIPRRLLEVLEPCACHRDPARWALMYRIVWRSQHAERHVLELASDPEVIELRSMERAVEHDCHKMHAFVRFRETIDEHGDPRFVAWFEPRHLILHRVAPFFVDRFAGMHWTIVTPDGAVQWDRSALTFLDRDAVPQLPRGDDNEILWRAYYSSIFNPARLNPRVTAQHMPKRYWRNLPEAADIPMLALEAPVRATQMLALQPRDTARWARAAPERAPRQPPAPLEEAIGRCRRCALWERATQAVCGTGPIPAALMLVGEQPGDEEDLKGKVFVGPAGRLLDRALAQAGIDRQSAYITNAVKHFKWEPRGKRRMHKTPAQMEIAACMEWLEREIEQVRPQTIVALGATALSALMKRHVSIAGARSQKLTHASGARVIATYHPAAILRASAEAESELYAALCGDLRAAFALS